MNSFDSQLMMQGCWYARELKSVHTSQMTERRTQPRSIGVTVITVG